MGNDSPSRFDVLVIGGGPAGMAAAVRAAECGGRVGMVDDNPTCGGQIWRGSEEHGEDAATWSERLRNSGITTLYGLRVFQQSEAGTLLAEGNDGICELRYAKLVLATGARERFLPFPGWTLPNVMGAGGLQAMVKSGLPIRGKRVVIAGTGPLLLAVASYLRKQGAEIPLISEQAPWSSLARFSGALLRYPGKIAQGLQLKKQLAGIPFTANSWPLAAHGDQTLESVAISRSGKTEVIPCDYLACGFHLVPNAELPALLGCKISDGYITVDDFQRTSVQGVFCAGEPTSIGGVDMALVEGQIAGLAAAGETKEARKLFGERRKARRLARMLNRTFSLRSELKELPSADTIVCRCEDVSYSRLQEHRSWRAAKLQTRCGMGPCQGRICGPATQFLFDWNPDSVRPPVFPARVESLANAAGTK
jgi:D-hydroxyproline dehydrogenase subunit alpha